MIYFTTSVAVLTKPDLVFLPELGCSVSPWRLRNACAFILKNGSFRRSSGFSPGGRAVVIGDACVSSPWGCCSVAASHPQRSHTLSCGPRPSELAWVTVADATGEGLGGVVGPLTGGGSEKCEGGCRRDLSAPEGGFSCEQLRLVQLADGPAVDVTP